MFSQTRRAVGGRGAVRQNLLALALVVAAIAMWFSWSKMSGKPGSLPSADGTVTSAATPASFSTANWTAGGATPAATPWPGSTPAAIGTPLPYPSMPPGQEDFANAEGTLGWSEVLALKIPPSGPQAIARGRAVFARLGNCVDCHGEIGRGDGPAGRALDPLPTNLTRVDDYKYGHGELGIYRTVYYGVDGTGMAPLEGVLTPDQVWDVTHYVRSLQGS